MFLGALHANKQKKTYSSNLREEREGKEERKRGCEDRQRYETQKLASRSHTSVGREQRGGGRDIGRKE